MISKRINFNNLMLAIRGGLILTTLFLIACTPAEKQCVEDSDCVPAQCFHATDAVNRNYAPDCTGLVGTLQCEPGTLDCGQGKIKCLEEVCTAVINAQS